MQRRAQAGAIGVVGARDCQRGPPRWPAGSHPPCPFSSVPGGAADIPVHHPGGGHHHGALCHRWAPGTQHQTQRGGSRHGVLHVLPQLGPWPGAAAPEGPCQDISAQATSWGPDRTVAPLSTFGTDQSHGCVCSGLPGHRLSGGRSPSPAVEFCACPPCWAWGTGHPSSRLRLLGKGELGTGLQTHFISGSVLALVFVPL